MSATAEADLVLTAAEIERLTGGLTQPRRQVADLQAQGFWRARLCRGEVILERAHYHAVCAGAVEPGRERSDTGRPQVLPCAS